MLQTIVVAVVIAAAVGYAGWRAYKLFKRSSDPCCCCDGCCEGCQLKDLKQHAGEKNAHCCEKK
jgi:hypothetical protein